ncbi:hypothetical protein HY358_01065 [Candidatus Roizmanbacteria bacterium]|nr:hypothetical protein [Candidatus Roizmanbacteria bacterium]
MAYQLWFGVTIPKGMWSKEIFEDNSVLFRTVNTDREQPLLGDIFVFRKVRDDPITYHLAVHTGITDKDSDPLLLHASRLADKVTIWPLREFLHNDRYHSLQAVKRLLPEFYSLFVSPQR